MVTKLLDYLATETQKLREAGLFKEERVITSPQNPWIRTSGREVVNFCANNYLGLSNHPRLIAAAQEALTRYGFGMSSVRFICGTQDIHKQLEAELSEFLGTEDTILYSSCFDANGGLFETILNEEDAVISDELNHASIIDGIRLCKAKRLRYKNNDMTSLEDALKEAKDCRVRLIATDGVFSMDGVVANLAAIRRLADKYDALLMVDDSHAVGFMGAQGRGTHEHHHLLGKVDIITGTLGKALGGASGGYTSGHKGIITWLRQRSRPYLFSNSLAPAITATSLAVLEFLRKSPDLQHNLWENTSYFRTRMESLGFICAGAGHPIIPVMVGDAAKAQEMARRLLEHDVYVIGFSFPVVPHGKARIRTQISAAHTTKDLDRAIAAFASVGKAVGLIN